jgi:hypothetical protein
MASRLVTPAGKPLGRMALQRHKDGHLPQALLKAQDEEDVRVALDVVQQLKAANSAAWQVLQRARQQSNDHLVLAAVDRVQRHIELVARLREAADAAELQARLARLEERLTSVGVRPALTRPMGGAGWPRTAP